MASGSRRPSVAPPAVSASPVVNEKGSKSRFSDIPDVPPEQEPKKTRTLSYRATSNLSVRSTSSKSSPKKDGIAGTGAPIINISATDKPPKTDDGLGDDALFADALANELDFVTVTAADSIPQPRLPDKASRLLGIKHRRSMEPIPASGRNSIMSTRSARDPPPSPSFIPTLPLTSLYVVSGLPKSPHTWTLADPDSVLGLHHSEGAVSRWWRPEVLGSTVSPGCGGGKKKKKGKGESEVMKGAGALTKQEVGKMLSKALKACPSSKSFPIHTTH
jgi:nicotinamide N-methyltransferase